MVVKLPPGAKKSGTLPPLPPLLDAPDQLDMVAVCWVPVMTSESQLTSCTSSCTSISSSPSLLAKSSEILIGSGSSLAMCWSDVSLTASALVVWTEHTGWQTIRLAPKSQREPSFSYTITDALIHNQCRFTNCANLTHFNDPNTTKVYDVDFSSQMEVSRKVSIMACL